jgi:16S rRNA (adenine1518-N6/adenine1519-N6)-dimethyltransferase
VSRRRALGQHFLRDPGIARAIVELLAPTPRDLVVEIGPGEGALTDELARRAGRLVALEVDRALLERLRHRLPDVEVLEADARTWDYGRLALSVLTQSACDVELVLRVPPGAFRPPPKVESAVVRMRPRPQGRVPIELATRFREVVRAAFARRRKTLANALAGGLGRSLDSIRQAAAQSGVDPGRRAETLTIEEFVALTARL